MLPIHREGAIRPLPWFICIRVVAHDSQVPSDTWDPEDPRPSFFGWAAYWAHAKSKISATACGSLSGPLAGGTQLQWIPAAPTVTAEVGPSRLAWSAVPELQLSSTPWPGSLELLLAAVFRGFGYSKPMSICGSGLWNWQRQGPVADQNCARSWSLEEALTVPRATKNLKEGVCLKK